LTYQQLEMMNSASVPFESENTSKSDYNEWAQWMAQNGGTGEELGEQAYDPDGAAASQQLFGSRD